MGIVALGKATEKYQLYLENNYSGGYIIDGWR